MASITATQAVASAEGRLRDMAARQRASSRPTASHSRRAACGSQISQRGAQVFLIAPVSRSPERGRRNKSYPASPKHQEGPWMKESAR
jgi:hypothetical protein